MEDKEIKLDWLKIAGIIALIGVIAIVGYGCYRWYFNRPPQHVYQNTYQNYTVMPGANQTISNYEAKGTKQKLNGVSVGAASDKSVFVSYTRFF